MTSPRVRTLHFDPSLAEDNQVFHEIRLCVRAIPSSRSTATSTWTSTSTYACRWWGGELENIKVAAAVPAPVITTPTHTAILGNTCNRVLLFQCQKLEVSIPPHDR